jgi:hypothetical protein
MKAIIDALNAVYDEKEKRSFVSLTFYPPLDAHASIRVDELTPNNHAERARTAPVARPVIPATAGIESRCDVVVDTRFRGHDK